jgi:hypothetical protein
VYNHTLNNPFPNDWHNAFFGSSRESVGVIFDVTMA